MRNSGVFVLEYAHLSTPFLRSPATRVYYINWMCPLANSSDISRPAKFRISWSRRVEQSAVYSAWQQPITERIQAEVKDIFQTVSMMNITRRRCIVFLRRSKERISCFINKMSKGIVLWIFNIAAKTGAKFKSKWYRTWQRYICF